MHRDLSGPIDCRVIARSDYAHWRRLIMINVQGYRNTYYVGALFSFAESAKIMEHAYVLVNKHF